jgi:phospholipid transport system transporter-binding protein
MIARQGDLFCVQGPVTMSNVEAVLEEGRRVFDGSHVRIDMSAVSEVDSSALSLVLQWLRDAARSGRRLTFLSLNDNMRSLATLYGVSELIPTEQSSVEPTTSGTGL